MTNTTEAPATGYALRSLLSRGVSIAALAGALIHLDAAGEHTDLSWVMAGFVAMTVAQTLVAVWVWGRPTSSTALWAALLVHVGILATWVLTRTVGLPFVPGAEVAVPVGVSDLAANVLSLAVVAATAVGLTLGDVTIPLPRRAVGVATAASLVGVLMLSLVAVTAPHDHAGADHDASVAEVHAGDHDH
jgi:hypothetical protein